MYIKRFRAIIICFSKNVVTFVVTLVSWWPTPKFIGRGPLKPPADTSDTAGIHQKLILKKVLPEVNASETVI
jgi:hypothetical protein